MVDISKLYLRDLYLNKNIDILVNVDIFEYDLKSANTSLCREYQLLPSKDIDEIEVMNKKDRVTKIGKLMRSNQTFKNGLKDAFIDIRRRFFEANDIEDSDILSVKKDAIFTLRKCKIRTFGYCNFVPKNQYSSYMYINNLEMYYKPNIFDYNESVVDVKGISDICLKKHDKHMIMFLRHLFRHLEESSQETQYSYIKNFMDNYKGLKLNTNYYREFDTQSIIRMNDSDVLYDDVEFIPYENKNEHVDISYNFANILLPIIRLMI